MRHLSYEERGHAHTRRSHLTASDPPRRTDAHTGGQHRLRVRETRSTVNRDGWVRDTDRVRGPPERAGMAAGARVTER